MAPVGISPQSSTWLAARPGRLRSAAGLAARSCLAARASRVATLGARRHASRQRLACRTLACSRCPLLHRGSARVGHQRLRNCPESGHLSVFSLRAGDCFQNPSGSQPTSGLTQVTAVPCVNPHNAQVIAQLPVPGSAYPGQAAFSAQAMPGCKASTTAVVDRSKLTATMNLIWIYPEPQAWADGHRTISCLIVDSSEDLTSSLLK